MNADLDKPAWRVMFRQLVALGLARPDHDARGALRLTEAARPVLRGEQPVRLRRVIPRARKPSNSPLPVKVDVNVDAVDAELLSRLKRWRAEQARTQSVPTYVILHASALAAIATVQPRDWKPCLRSVESAQESSSATVRRCSNC